MLMTIIFRMALNPDVLAAMHDALKRDEAFSIYGNMEKRGTTTP